MKTRNLCIELSNRRESIYSKQWRWGRHLHFRFLKTSPHAGFAAYIHTRWRVLGLTIHKLHLP
jgi:hypothetical protein